MATVQRKLVHKQFNSPIGLYSDNNVKATLDRELKVLSNGTMGIDFDDISKPANLANSAVLRMLEEEENQKRHGRQPDSSNDRKSRPRIRDIDRETVLSINRKLVCRCKRELSWPPINNTDDSNEKMKLSKNMFSNHDIKDVCRILDKPLNGQNKNLPNGKKASYGTSFDIQNKATTAPIITISDIDSNNDTNPAASNNHNNNPIESINENPTNNTDNRHTSDNKIHTSYIDSIETIKPFCDRKIATINNNNSPHRADKDQRKALLKRSKSYDSTISNIIVNEINNRKNTNLHFIGYCEWLRCSSYNELASLQWKNYIFPSEHPQENLSENEKTIKLQVYQTDRYCCDDSMSENKYQNIKINLISPDFDNIVQPIQLEECLPHQCCKCGNSCGRNIFKYSDNDRNRFFDENSRIDIEKNDLICCNTSNHIGNSDEFNEWMGCIRHGNESENNCSLNVSSIMKWPKRRSDSRNDGGLKRVAWPPEPEYQSPSRVVPQPQQSPAQGNSYQPSQNQYPSQYNNNARQQSHESPAVVQRSPYQQQQQSPSVYPQQSPQPTYQQQHLQSYPNQQTQAPYQQSQPSYQQQQFSNDRQQTPADSHPQPIYQRQHSQSQPRQSRLTPARTFPNPEPIYSPKSLMTVNKPAYLQPSQPSCAKSPSTSAFAGGVAVNPPQQSPSLYHANGGASPHYQQQSSPNYQQQSQSSPNYYQQQQPQSSPQYQSNSSLPLSPDPNRSLPGWSPVRKPVQIQSGYTLNNQRPSAESYGGQSYAGNQSTPSYQPTSNFDQYQPPYQPQQQQPQPQQQYQPQQQQQYQTPPSNEPQYQAQQPYYRQPSPGVITLRKEAPFNQPTAPVYASQPAAASFGGGTNNMRGDQKWPPQEYKLQSEIDNEARRRLAQGPILRPRRVQKDYSQFFNQHALNSTYPAYRAPPGTQHYPAH